MNLSPTHVLYVDDSGTKEYAASPSDYSPRGNSRFFVFGGVLIGVDESARMVAALRSLKRQYFGTDAVEIKSNWLRMPREQEARYLKPYSLGADKLKQFVEELYRLIQRFDLQLIAAVVDKVHMQEQYPSPWYAPAIAYEILLQRVALEVVGSDEQVVVIVDDMSGATPKGNQYKINLRRQHERLRQYGSSLYKGLSFSRIGNL